MARRPAGRGLPSARASSPAIARSRKYSKVLRFSQEASAARTWICVSRFSQMRGAARKALGPSSRRSRCTVSGLSGQLQAKPTMVCTAWV